MQHIYRDLDYMPSNLLANIKREYQREELGHLDAIEQVQTAIGCSAKEAEQIVEDWISA